MNKERHKKREMKTSRHKQEFNSALCPSYSCFKTSVVKFRNTTLRWKKLHSSHSLQQQNPGEKMQTYNPTTLMLYELLSKFGEFQVGSPVSTNVEQSSLMAETV